MSKKRGFTLTGTTTAVAVVMVLLTSIGTRSVLWERLGFTSTAPRTACVQALVDEALATPYSQLRTTCGVRNFKTTADNLVVTRTVTYQMNVEETSPGTKHVHISASWTELNQTAQDSADTVVLAP